MKFSVLLLLFVCLSVSACGVKLETKKNSSETDERANLTGMTPAFNDVKGTTVDAKLSITPSSQVVRGYNVGAKISVQ